jgi:ribosomal protein S18 acetylase RimI-like enzyme
MIHIARAQTAHISPIVNFNMAMALETENKVLEEEKIHAGVSALIADPSRGFYLLALSGEEVIGQLMITCEWSDWRNSNIWWIQSVYVRPECRRQGVYSLLYAEVCRLAREKGITTLRLYVEKQNIAAKETYAKLGMEESIYDMYEAILPLR